MPGTRPGLTMARRGGLGVDDGWGRLRRPGLGVKHHLYRYLQAPLFTNSRAGICPVIQPWR